MALAGGAVLLPERILAVPRKKAPSLPAALEDLLPAPIPLEKRALPAPTERYVVIERVEEEEEETSDVEPLDAIAVDGANSPIPDLPMQIWIDGRPFAITTDLDGRFRIPSFFPRRSAEALACGRYSGSARLEGSPLVFVFDRFGE